jgi:hypothetical protein
MRSAKDAWSATPVNTGSGFGKEMEKWIFFLVVT